MRAFRMNCYDCSPLDSTSLCPKEEKEILELRLREMMAGMAEPIEQVINGFCLQLPFHTGG